MQDCESSGESPDYFNQLPSEEETLVFDFTLEKHPSPARCSSHGLSLSERTPTMTKEPFESSMPDLLLFEMENSILEGERPSVVV